MFFRTKKSGPRTYLQLVENHWHDGRPQQTVLATLGRLDELQQRGAVDSLLRSGARFAGKLLVLTAHQRGELTAVRTLRLGAVLIFERLWRETGCAAVLAQEQPRDPATEAKRTRFRELARKSSEMLTDAELNELRQLRASFFGRFRRSDFCLGLRQHGRTKPGLRCRSKSSQSLPRGDRHYPQADRSG